MVCWLSVYMKGEYNIEDFCIVVWFSVGKVKYDGRKGEWGVECIGIFSIIGWWLGE